MKINFLFVILIFCKISLSNEIIDTYNYFKNIPYYPISHQQDKYLKEKCLLDIAIPKDKKDFVTIIWFHGGGLSGGEKYFPKLLLNGENAIVAVGYRLYPNVKAPLYIEDAAAAISFVLDNIEKYGGNKNKIVVSGHSAGGYLTLMTGMDPKYLSKFGHSPKELKLLLPLSPQTITHFTIRKEKNIKEGTVIVDSLAPMFFVDKDTPSIHLICGDRNLELFKRYEESQYFIEMLKFNGRKDVYLYELQGFDHGDMVEPGCILINKIIKQYLK